MVLKRRTMTPAELAALENAEAQVQRNADLIEYVAMMADVEIPIEEEGADDE